MSNTDTIVILIAFAAYLMLMIVIGAIYMKNTNNSEDYFLGGRGLSGWVAALSGRRPKTPCMPPGARSIASAVAFRPIRICAK